MATNREDLVWAATLHCPRYDSADVAEKTMNPPRERQEQTGAHGESAWVAYIWEMRALPLRTVGIKRAWRAVIYWVCGGPWQARLSLDRQSFN